MKSFLFALIAGFLITGCGVQTLSETDALEMLQSVPLAPGQQNVLGEYSATSYDEFEAVLARYAGDGEERGLFGKKKKTTSLGTLRNLFTVLQSGEATDADSLAYALVDADGGDVQKTALNLDSILKLIEKVAPFISMLFPSFGPIIDALLKIIPLLLSIFG